MLAKDDVLGMYLAQDGRCAVTGLKMTIDRGWRGVKPRTLASIDRINSKGHYTRDNVQMVCWAINYMKGDLTPDEFTFWCAKVILGNDPDQKDDEPVSAAEVATC